MEQNILHLAVLKNQLRGKTKSCLRVTCGPELEKLGLFSKEASFADHII